MGLVKDYGVESIIHLAGASRAGKLPVHEIIQVNVMGSSTSWRPRESSVSAG